MVLARWQWMVLGLGSLVLAGYIWLLSWALLTQSYNVWGALILAPVIVAINVVLLWSVRSHERDRWIRGLLYWAFAAKMVGTLVRYYVALVVYQGQADAMRYNYYAATHYEEWRQGFVLWEIGAKQGTQNMELLTTALYVLIGPSPLAAFLIFGSVAFWGAYLLYRAFRIALPGGDYRRYALLVFLLPSLLYWPSSIGKESVLFLFLGVTALGAAKYFNHRPVSGLILVAVGAVGSALIRPHVTVLMLAALFVAQIVRPTEKTSTSVLTKGAGILILGVAGLILVTQTAQFLGIDDLDWQAVAETVDAVGSLTGEGGSTFTPVSLASPLGIPAAIVTLLFRPFPWEAENAQMVLQSLEGVFLMGLTLFAWPRLKALPRLLTRSPYLVFCVVYTLAFIFAFSGFANFGILARQRVLMLPFFLVLLALPEPVRTSGRRRADRPRTLAGVGGS